MAAAVQRPYQVVVWGATGFTGKLVCEHLVRDYQGRVRWAMAGRDARKLETVREELARINPAAKDVPILLADAQDSKAVGNVLGQAQVVLSLAGPFAKYGNTVVEQAVAQGTHYCDITGELPWVKRTVQQYHTAARAKGVKIVHCCGYDSIPSDMGVVMMADYCEKQLGKKLSKVYTLISSSRGGVSGGTIASALNMAEEEPVSELLKLGSDAYYLSEAVTSKRGSDRPAPNLPTYLDETKTWAGPWVMEGCNARIVQYSNALRPKPYGSDFQYLEMIECGKGLMGVAKATAIAAFMGVMGISFALWPLRTVLKKVLPGSGSGPSLEMQRTGFWTHKVVAVTEESAGAPPTIVTGLVADKRDPGYWSTSRMILETGLALVLDADAIQQLGTCQAGGVLTPATAAGTVLMERLKKAGFTFQVHGPMGRKD